MKILLECIISTKSINTIIDFLKGALQPGNFVWSFNHLKFNLNMDSHDTRWKTQLHSINNLKYKIEYVEKRLLLYSNCIASQNHELFSKSSAFSPSWEFQINKQFYPLISVLFSMEISCQLAFRWSQMFSSDVNVSVIECIFSLSCGRFMFVEQAFLLMTFASILM